MTYLNHRFQDLDPTFTAVWDLLARGNLGPVGTEDESFCLQDYPSNAVQIVANATGTGLAALQPSQLRTLESALNVK